jgi:hypothetical protein
VNGAGRRLWLEVLRVHPEGWQAFLAECEADVANAQRKVNDASSWEQFLAAREAFRAASDRLLGIRNFEREEERRARRAS